MMVSNNPNKSWQIVTPLQKRISPLKIGLIRERQQDSLRYQLEGIELVDSLLLLVLAGGLVVLVELGLELLAVGRSGLCLGRGRVRNVVDLVGGGGGAF